MAETTPSPASDSWQTFLSLCFLGGALGALANSVFVWFLGVTGINSALGVGIAPPLTWEWIRPRLVWGGLWGLVFILVRNQVKQGPWLWGFLIGLLPTINQLLYVFPVMAGKGVFGLQLGALAPAVVICANTVWGWVTAAWIGFASRG